MATECNVVFWNGNGINSGTASSPSNPACTQDASTQDCLPLYDYYIPSSLTFTLGYRTEIPAVKVCQFNLHYTTWSILHPVCENLMIRLNFTSNASCIHLRFRVEFDYNLNVLLLRAALLPLSPPCTAGAERGSEEHRTSAVIISSSSSCSIEVRSARRGQTLVR